MPFQRPWINMGDFDRDVSWEENSRICFEVKLDMPLLLPAGALGTHPPSQSNLCLPRACGYRFESNHVVSAAQMVRRLVKTCYEGLHVYSMHGPDISDAVAAMLYLQATNQLDNLSTLPCPVAYRDYFRLTQLIKLIIFELFAN